MTAKGETRALLTLDSDEVRPMVNSDEVLHIRELGLVLEKYYLSGAGTLTGIGEELLDEQFVNWFSKVRVGTESDASTTRVNEYYYRHL